MKATNQITAARPAAPANFAAFVNQEKIISSLTQQIGGDTSKAARLIATMKRIVTKTPKLQNCEFGTIIQAVTYGEIGLELSEEFGEYSVVPYFDKATFQIGSKGLQQLAIRSGKYAAIDCFDVRSGEYKGRDPRTRAPIFEWIEDDDVRDTLPIVGYYAFFILNDQFNGYFNSIYWTHDKILRHADRYSKAFSLKTYNAILNGELSPEEVAKKQTGSPWYALPDEEPHIKMCKKTVFKQLLSDGRAPKSVREVVALDNSQESAGEAAIPDSAPMFPSADIPNTLPSAAQSENFAADETSDVDPVIPAAPAQNSVKPPKSASAHMDSFFDGV